MNEFTTKTPHFNNMQVKKGKLLLKEEIFSDILSSVVPLGEKFIFSSPLGLLLF